MKKLILTLVFLFAMGTSSQINANSMEFEEAFMEMSCMDHAWDFGTFAGNGNPALEYYYTNLFYTTFCEPQ